MRTRITALTELIEKLTIDEARLVTGLTNGHLPTTWPEKSHELLAHLDSVDVFVQRRKEDLGGTFARLQRQITRGIGQTIINRDGCAVKIGDGKEFHVLQDEYGPRGIWHQRWEPVFKSLLEKIEELQRTTPLPA